jgi:malonate decarboxylase alpha subunit
VTEWQKQRSERKRRLEAASKYAKGKLVSPQDAKSLLEAVVRPGDRVCLEGDNQKQADFLADALASVEPARIHDLHLVQSGVVLQAHLDLFNRGIARRLDFSYSGPQSEAIARALAGGKIELGAVHTYIELFARYFMDLTPHVALIAAVAADPAGNLYTGPNTEDTPTIVEATAFKSGIVVAQANQVVEKLPRVDIPGDQVDFIVEADRPFYVEPLFTRDPGSITEAQILMAMMAIKGIYAKYGVRLLNHGIGFPTAAIELILPTYGEQLGLKGKVATHFALNPHPTLIPAIESGWVEQIHCFGGEVGMEDYVRERSDVYFTGHDGSLRSNRMMCQNAGLYACDMFIGSTLQIDLAGNSSTFTSGRIAGFGGAPNMGADAAIHCTRRATCSPRIRSRISCHGPADSITRRPNSGIGDPWSDSRSAAPPRGVSPATAARPSPASTRPAISRFWLSGYCRATSAWSKSQPRSPGFAISGRPSSRSAPGGLRFSINDGGARPDVVTLRLMQGARLMEGGE